MFYNVLVCDNYHNVLDTKIIGHFCQDNFLIINVWDNDEVNTLKLLNILYEKNGFASL